MATPKPSELYPETAQCGDLSALGILDALAISIAVVDSSGVIVAVNEAWRRFAAANGGTRAVGVGANYLATCDRAREGGGDETAALAADSIRGLLGGRAESFSIEYPCHSPEERRWFVANGTVLTQGGARYVVIAHDNVTARKLAEDALRASESTLRQVLELLPVGVWILDAGGRFVHGNPAGHRIWAGDRFVRPEQFGEYKGWWLSSGEPIAAEEWAAARAVRHGETSLDEEILIECFDGTRKVILNSALPLRDSEGRIAGAIVVNQDVSERKEAENALERANRELEHALAGQKELARSDFLTGLSNRRHFYEVAEHELAIAGRYRHPLSVILFDVDHFKAINDRLGHDVGDRVLQQVARAARSCLREADTLARYGGEEFAVLLPHIDGHQAAVAAEHIRAAIATLGIEADGARIELTVSAGIAEAMRAGDSIDRLLRHADEALYAAKAAGRNTVVWEEHPSLDTPGVSGS